jgi:hypothetical protein
MLQEAVTFSSTGRGFGPPAAQKQEAAAVATVPSGSSVNGKFLSWAEEEGIKTLVPLAVGDFGGERGVGATAEVEAGAGVLSVPSKLTLQVNSLSKCPRWCDEEAWKASKWDARLAMLLLHEENDASSQLKPWLSVLPRDFVTPALSPSLLSGIEAIEYPALPRAVRLQREQWDAARTKAPGAPTQAQWDWAMSVVRSRSFSGPYTPGTFVGALAQLFAAATLALGYALVVGGAGSQEQALNGFLGAAVFVACNDLVFGPRFSKAKRYVLCPWIDLLNHDGALGGSEVAYEYFADAFTARLDFDAGPVAEGSQLMISYGPRSNDVLLQYYGFVQADNPHDVFEMDQETLVLEFDKVGMLSEGALKGLQAAGLVQAQAPLSLTRGGGDELALRLARFLTHPELAAADSGCEPLKSDAEANAMQALAAVARARLAALDVCEEGALKGTPQPMSRSLLAAFIREKQKVLRASADALEQRARVALS